jgi:hypothetical protein
MRGGHHVAGVTFLLLLALVVRFAVAVVCVVALAWVGRWAVDAARAHLERPEPITLTEVVELEDRFSAWLSE